MNAPNTLEPDTSFIRLSKVDVAKHVEKKAGFSYLSWPFAVSQLRQIEPAATWEVKRFDGVPYLKTELGYFVEVEVTVNGIALSQIHPVLDNRNKPIAKPSAFEINTSIQRCLVKAIALHGLGLQLYAGEDLPLVSDETETVTEKPINKHTPVNASMEGVVIPEKIMEELRFLASELVDLVESKGNPSKARDLLDSTRLGEDEESVTGDYLIALSQILQPNSKTRSALKKEGEARRAAAKTPLTEGERLAGVV